MSSRPDLNKHYTDSHQQYNKFNVKRQLNDVYDNDLYKNIKDGG